VAGTCEHDNKSLSSLKVGCFLTSWATGSAFWTVFMKLVTVLVSHFKKLGTSQSLIGVYGHLFVHISVILMRLQCEKPLWTWCTSVSNFVSQSCVCVCVCILPNNEWQALQIYVRKYVVRSGRGLLFRQLSRWVSSLYPVSSPRFEPGRMLTITWILQVQVKLLLRDDEV
jgi:hypothetical protein